MESPTGFGSELVEHGGSRSWENLKKAGGLKDRASTMHNLKYYGSCTTTKHLTLGDFFLPKRLRVLSTTCCMDGGVDDEQRRLYQELPFRVLPGMRCRSFRSEREYPHLRPRSSWANLLREIVPTSRDRQPLLPQDDDDRAAPGYTAPLLVSSLVAVLNAFQYGYNTAVTGALTADMVVPGGHASPVLWAVCVSSFAVGGPVGSILGGHVGATLGRKPTICANACLFVLAGLVMALAVNLYMLLLGRFLVGMASGTATVLVPLYLGELAPPHLRGALGTTYQVAMVAGILATDLLAFAFASESDGWTRPGWRVLVGFTALLGALQLALNPLLLESPRWLLDTGDAHQAEKTLQHVRQTDHVGDELNHLAAATASESGDVKSVVDVLGDRSIRLPLLVAVVLQLGQQLSGINAVMFYASSFFQSAAGLAHPLVGITLVYLVNVVATIVALVLMDSVGRRPLLLSSVLGMLVSCGILTAGLMHVVPWASLLSVGGVTSFVWFFELGLGPIPWLMAAELFPPKSRTAATSIATMVNWLGLFVVGIVFPTMQDALGNAIFMPFALCLVLTLGFALQFVPETKGKTLDEIYQDLSHTSSKRPGPPPRRS
ncbi:hypothetical protein PsorP6_001824 [Peronosclerospora sorghi]|uniref:Uncharacterized protein n=1 Tax=Peronosclerospora sorghi TaxID=230839 RepID=A0ACC0WT35_9STRA|nr:hypothetical protein PsorP6_001824 [Peronosclerospora sorghi]